MQIYKAGVFAVLLLATACATTPPPLVQLRDLPIGNTEIDLLADLMRREDNRQYDSAAFHGFVTAQSPVVRRFAVRALGRIGNHAANGLLLRALTDSNRQVAAEAAFALGELGDTSAHIITALGALSAGDAVDAAEAVAALGKLRTATARAYVERILNGTPSPPVLQEALLAVWRFPRSPAATPSIVKHTRNPEEAVRWRATYALTRGFADPAAIPVLIDLLRGEGSGWTQSFAARGLRAASADSAGRRAEAFAALLGRIRDPIPAVRINAIVALGGYRDSTASPRIAQLLTHHDPNTRVVAAQTLGTSGGATAMSFLSAKVTDTAERAVVRGTALASLMNLAPDLAMPMVRQLKGDANWLSRLYAARALAAAQSSAALPVLRDLAGDRDARVAVAAVETAANTRDTLPAARALFIEKLGAGDPFVRAAALSGLERYADPADQILLFDAYARALRDSVPEPAVAALNAIAKLVPKNPAVERAFRVRFISRGECLHPDVRSALDRHFKLEDQCGVAATARVYEQLVRDLVVPAIQGTNPRARITTAGTTIEIELLAAEAPLTVRNFMALADRRYFDGSRWHRLIPNFVLQDGDPYGNGSGGPGYAIRDEMNRVRYLDGAVGMALSGPDTGGSQFFITHSPQPHLDGGYTVFGRVVPELSAAAYLITQDDVIERIEIIR
jgi:cyclophilin family peptidyl-prolyl cis-trans isomerase